jgi:hypothetical protein
VVLGWEEVVLNKRHPLREIIADASLDTNCHSDISRSHIQRHSSTYNVVIFALNKAHHHLLARGLVNDSRSIEPTRHEHANAT